MRCAQCQDQVGNRHGTAEARGNLVAVQFAAAVGFDQRAVDDDVVYVGQPTVDAFDEEDEQRSLS